MDTFLHISLSFPTAIWTTALLICLLFLVIAMLGMADFDIPGVDVDLDVDADAELPGVAGWLSTFGLTGVPVPVILTLLALYAWLASYFAAYLVMPSEAGLMSWLIGTVISLGAFVVAIPCTAITIRPLRKLFGKAQRQVLGRYAIGKNCTIRSSRVDETFGEAHFNYEGASLIIQVRAPAHLGYKSGDEVTIVRFIPEQGCFQLAQTH
ncbi:OB-fold-containig protein [Reinekea blandensis]|uniref:Uncharacterized protein n=1 Tax=Reinekea blandensis MED297 TaxID=314283 RepID=A4BJ74_9GAMM|nr:OB-fold-containig protein [Reinekea blandensis]EAR07827.1 hypothetical protein MED297_05264 [Reinekea sp. MED297] [Reinekea blandensis MED297]